MWSVEQGWKSMTCTCAYQDNSGRKEMRRRLEALTDGDESKKKCTSSMRSEISALIIFPKIYIFSEKTVTIVR